MARQKRQPCPQTDALGEQLGQTIQCLRTAGNLSLGDLSNMSGIAKSMISQIENNKTNPTLATLFHLSQALGTSVGAVLAYTANDTALLQRQGIQDTPLIMSEDGLCELRIIGWIEAVQWLQIYDFRAQPGGRLVSSPHPPGSVENLTLLSGELKVSVEAESWTAQSGETLRYRADRHHGIKNVGGTPAHATVVNILAHSVK
ncbi:MAG: helix-turn-helix transcriptional regulator [Hyphomonadaceae bacterium]|nr:helix-turn-helix transcriptional regulator [Hyphomonadaceae bacterium]MBC6411673.1 helix-turn-helix transcriptional regulator [Hyphomonadaceae bacterium]